METAAQTNSDTRRKISFVFRPSDGYAVEKDVNGKKRRYLMGVASGTKVDHHGERMSEKAISSFHNQSKSGEILLYPDVHGIKSSDDIGRLVESSVAENGEWVAKFQLYDGDEGAQPYQVQRAAVVWNQINGLPPYAKKQERGFSIEGYIPDDGLADSTIATGEKVRVIDKIDLDGVVLVKRPAYKTSIAGAVYKALDEKAPWNTQKIVRKSLKDALGEQDSTNAYYQKRYRVEEALQTTIEEIMKDATIAEKGPALESAFDEFKSLMLPLILASTVIFKSEDDQRSLIPEADVRVNQLIRALEKTFKGMRETISTPKR